MQPIRHNKKVAMPLFVIGKGTQSAALGHGKEKIIAAFLCHVAHLHYLCGDLWAIPPRNGVQPRGQESVSAFILHNEIANFQEQG